MNDTVLLKRCTTCWRDFYTNGDELLPLCPDCKMFFECLDGNCDLCLMGDEYA